MHKNDTDFYNDFFAGLEGCQLEEKFKSFEGDPFYHGRINIGTAKGPLVFEVLLPEDYPFGEAHFYCRTIKGYSHQSQSIGETLGGSACLNTPFVDHLHTRLTLEVKKLYRWIEDFYVNDTAQDYEYPAFHAQGRAHLLFSETAEDLTAGRFGESLFGAMTYTVLSQQPAPGGRGKNFTLLAQRLGGIETRWSETYKAGERYKGVWALLEKEPVVRHRLKMDTWEQLHDLLPHSFSDYFLEFCQRNAKYTFGPDGLRDNILLALGYKIPTLDGKEEVHWDLVLVPASEFRRADLRRRPRHIRNLKGPVLWDESTNSSYNRFFGRGMLNSSLISKNILVIGTGAIGSSLAEMLVRGGAISITLADSDKTEPGNICRSKLTFRWTNMPKTYNLRASLLEISPFVELKTIGAIFPTAPKGRSYQNTVAALNQYDLIFDCSADNQVLQMLSYGNVIAPVISLSITNRAKQLLCLSSWDSPRLIEMKSMLMSWLQADHYPNFKPGTGCWHFTFEASNIEVNALLNKALVSINASMTDRQKPETFVLSAETNSPHSKLSFKKYVQAETGLRLRVSSRAVETILSSSYSHFPNEYGGLLMGTYSEDLSEAMVLDVVLPSKFKSTPVSFTPDTDDLNERLIRFVRDNGKTAEYLGEWHSHPNGSGQYSPKDLASLKDIAESATVALKNPILLIASGQKGKMKLNFYLFIENKLYKFSPCD
ncbi:hypothetical protein TH61_05305 [Rufibacter sp. DG15C]|uniref:ThiF family adenylyltransferase n=1 Tax=Rufibacter sp. DG15C TaxID=1379909 RepID=UPI00078B31B7|nr:ThiF family adenylyltransferase [Rufibacter sp. DG15C]AMM50709.1 hypothetical protein TH61_05305 [Rufibacter sp. DG15C]